MLHSTSVLSHVLLQVFSYLVDFEEMQLLLPGFWMNFIYFHLSWVQKWISLANRATSLRIFMHPICHEISITISCHRGRGPHTEFDFQQSDSGAASCGLGSCGFLRMCSRVGRGGHQKRDATVTWPARWGIRKRNGLWHLGKDEKEVLIADMSIFCMVKSCF